MKRSNRLVILVGVLLAVLAFVAIVILLNQRTTRRGGGGADDRDRPRRDAGHRHRRRGHPGPRARRRRSTPRPFSRRHCAARRQVARPAGTVRHPRGCAGHRGGDRARWSATHRHRRACCEPGEKAVTFQVDRVTGVDFLVKPGDTIDVVMSQQISVLQETADSAANTDPEAAAAIRDRRRASRTSAPSRPSSRTSECCTSARRGPSSPSRPTTRTSDGVIDEKDEQPAQAVLDSVVIVFAGTDQDAEAIKFAQNDLTEFGASKRKKKGGSEHC